jgi:ribosomal protein S18 acetylase RimI-like enzyme
MRITLRAVEPADEPHLLAVYGGTREDELATTDWDDARKRAFVKQQFRAQDVYYRANYANASYDVILVDGQPAGRLYTARWPDEVRIMDIALLAPFRRRGVGSHLLKDLQREGAAAGKVLRIHVERFNPALSMYMRLGFRLVEDRGVYLFLEWSPDTAASGPVAQPTAQPTTQENTAS